MKALNSVFTLVLLGPYIRFQANFRLNKIPLKCVTYPAVVNHIIQFERFFIRLKLGIALAIPASNE